MVQAGDIAPDARIRALADEGPVWVAFFKISCPTCQLAFPFLERLHPGTRIYGISQNDADDTREFAERFSPTLPMLLDPEADDFPASNAFGITSVPTMFLVEPGGRIDRVIEGWDRAEMERLGAMRATDRVPAFKPG
jgi:hypothetical protein